MDVLLNLGLGLGIFLFGMRQLEDSLASLGSQRIKRFLARSTRRPLGSVASGTFITAILQSSSMVSLIVLAFASAGMIPLFNAVGVILGANLGTTFTGWIVATFGFKLDLAAIAMPLFGISALIYVFMEKGSRRMAVVGIAMGLGILLFGLEQMKIAVAEVPQWFDTHRLQGLNAFTYLLVGLGLTAVIQSSSAMTMIALTALHGGLIDLPAAAAIVIGADIGTTSTTMLGSLSGPPVAKQLALAHFIYNLFVDVMAFFLLLPLLPALLDVLGLTDPLYGLVVFHSSFNLLGLVVFVPILKPFSAWLEQRFVVPPPRFATHLDAVPPAVTEAAIVALHTQVRSLGERVFELCVSALHMRHLHGVDGKTLRVDDSDDYLAFVKRYEVCKAIEAEVHQYRAQLQANPIEPVSSQIITILMESTRNFIYAAKTLKDVADDLHYFGDDDAGAAVIVYPDELKEVFSALQEGLQGRWSPSSVIELQQTWEKRLEKSLGDMNAAVMRALHAERLNYAVLPSVLNAAREIAYATQSLLAACTALQEVQALPHMPGYQEAASG